MSRIISRRLRRLEDRLAPATLLHSLFPDSSGPQGGGFGNSVAMSPQYPCVGAPASPVFGRALVGQVFVYAAATHDLLVTLNNPSPAADEAFGTSVAIWDNYVVVGAPFDKIGGSILGRAYVYD